MLKSRALTAVFYAFSIKKERSRSALFCDVFRVKNVDFRNDFSSDYTIKIMLFNALD